MSGFTQTPGMTNMSVDWKTPPTHQTSTWDRLRGEQAIEKILTDMMAEALMEWTSGRPVFLRSRPIPWQHEPLPRTYNEYAWVWQQWKIERKAT